MNTIKPTHVLPHQFEVIGDCLHVGGIPVTRLAQRVGSTPFYAYDRNVISGRIQALRKVLPSNFRLNYSIKANPMSAVVQHLASLVDGFDIASGGELSIALDTTIKPQFISFTGPGKTSDDLRRAIAAGVKIHVESERELLEVDRIGKELQQIPAIMLRVNPDFQLKASGIKMGGGPKPFGIDAEMIPAMLEQVCDLRLAYKGLHIFSGSQNLNADAVIEEKTKVFELAMRLAETTSLPLTHLNIGGGFGIPYFPGDRPLELERIGQHLQQWAIKLQTALPKTEVSLEFGRYIVGEAGVYITRIVDRKISRGQTFLVTDGGLNHHLAASGNFGQVFRKNYPVAIANRMSGTQRETVSVVGPLCTPLDILADKLELAQAQIGDYVVIFQSGAYGLSASPTAFLGHPVAKEVLV